VAKESNSARKNGEGKNKSKWERILINKEGPREDETSMGIKKGRHKEEKGPTPIQEKIESVVYPSL